MAVEVVECDSKGWKKAWNDEWWEVVLFEFDDVLALGAGGADATGGSNVGSSVSTLDEDPPFLCLQGQSREPEVISKARFE